MGTGSAFKQMLLASTGMLHNTFECCWHALQYSQKRVARVGHETVACYATQCNAMHCSACAVQCGAMQRKTMRCNAMPTVLCSAVLCSMCR